MILEEGDVLLRPLSIKDTDFLLGIRNDLEFADEFFSDPPTYDFAHNSWLQSTAKNNNRIDNRNQVRKSRTD